MAISLVDSGTVEYPSGGTSGSFTLSLSPATFVVGDVLVVSVTTTSGATTSVTAPSGAVTVFAPAAGPDGVNGGVYVYPIPGPTKPGSVTWTWPSAQRGTLAWVLLRGVNTTTPVDASGVGAWSADYTTAWTAPSYSTVTDGAYLVAGVMAGTGSNTLTLPAGWTLRTDATQREGTMATAGVATSAGVQAGVTFSGPPAPVYGRAWQLALRAAGSGGGDTAIPGVSTTALTNPASRWTKGTTRVLWHDGTSWGAVLPTASGHRISTDLEATPAGAVVDSRTGARPTVAYATGWLGILRGHPTQSRFSSYNTSSAYAALVTDAVVPLTPANTDQSPIALTRSPNGYLWAAMVAANKVTVTRSTDNGATWGAAQDVVTGWTLFPTGTVALSVTGTTVVLLATGNDGSGRAALSIPQASASYAAASWTTETLPALASGITSDDHLSMTVAPDGRVLAAAKTTNGAANVQLIYLLVRSTGGTWTSSNIEVGPDDDTIAPGYTRPTITLTYDKVLVAYGSIYAPQALSYRTTSLASPGTWSARQTLHTGPNFMDGAQTPCGVTVRTARGDFPILAHQVTDGTITLSWMASDAPAIPVITYAIMGAPTPDGLKASLKVAGAQAVRLRSGTTYGPTATVDGDGWVQPSITGLPAFTTVTLDVEITEADGHTTLIPGVLTGKTSPIEGEPASFKVALGSCFEDTTSITTINSAGAFTRLKARNPDLALLLGDMPYGNNASTSQASHRADTETMLAYSAALRTVLSTTAVVPQQSDHDFGDNNAFPGTQTPGNRAAYRQVWPMHPLSSSTGQYRAFTYGRVRFIVTDTRSFANPDGSTRLGATQKAWFKAELQRPEPVKVWVQESIWIDDKVAEPGGDKWQNFPAEKAELGAFIASSAVGQVVTATGDQHAVAADDGSNNPWGGFPSFCAAPFRNLSSRKTTSNSKWSHGIYPTTEGVEVAQDGLLTVTDTGTSITLAFRAYDTSNTQRVSLDVVVDTTPPESSGPKVITAPGVETAATWSVVTAPGVETPITSWGVITAPGVETALV